MALQVNTSIVALKTQHSISINANEVNSKLERLSTGVRINRAADDASGLVISEGMRGEIVGLEQNVRNAQQGVDLLQTAEGALHQVNSILIRMRELAVHSSTSTINDSNREALTSEFVALTAEIDRIAQSTSYNKTSLLSGFGNQASNSSTALTASNTTGVVGVSIAGASPGTFTFIDSAADNELTLGNGTITQTIGISTKLEDRAVPVGKSITANFERIGLQVSLAGIGARGATGDYTDGDLNGTQIIVESVTGGVFQLGPRNLAYNRLELGIPDLRATGSRLNLDTLSVSSLTNGQEAITGIDLAIDKVTAERGKLGAVQNRLAASIAQNRSGIENMQASESTIRDADFALEIAEMSRSQILLQASNAMLVQVNVGAVQILSLF